MLTGHTIKGRYRIYNRLGQGGAATAYLARDLEEGQMVVIKIVHPHLVNDQFIARFEREIDILQQLTSPHIIRLFDWALREDDEETGERVSYIVAEYVQGHNLADVIDTQGKMDPGTALPITRQLALALSEVHSKGIVHRDVNAQNVMITPDNTAKLIDFGIAKGPNHATLTDPSHFAGTLYYAPPEQILETYNVDHRADLYALGVVLFEMLMAALPVQSRKFGEAASRIIDGDLDPITGVSRPIEKLVNYMLATEIENRVPSADEVINIIDSIGAVPVEADLPETIIQTGDDIPEELRFFDSTLPIEIKLMYVLTANDGREFALDKAETIIGRSHPRDAVSPDIDLMQLGIEHARTASRRHFRVYNDDGEYYVEDLGSMNGTRLNGDPLKQGNPKHLELGDIVTAGRVELVFYTEAGVSPSVRQ